MRDSGLQPLRGFLRALLWAGFLGVGLAAAGPSRAQDFRFEDLGAVRAAGEIAPEAFLNQFILLDVAETGHYTLSMASPGALLLHAFETEDRLPQDGVSPKLLRREGSPYIAPRMTNLLLEAGRPYLLQAASARPQPVMLELITPLSAARPLAEEAASKDAPLGLAPGLAAWLQRDRNRDIFVQGATPDRMRLEVIAPPDIGPAMRLGARGIGEGGLFPRRFDGPTAMVLNNTTRKDGTIAPVMLSVSALESPGEEVEPNTQGEGGAPQDLGPLSAGRSFAGHLMAPLDVDRLQFTLEAPALLSLTFEIDARASAKLTLTQTAPAPGGPVLELQAVNGYGKRPDLALPAGTYLLSVEGGADAAPSAYSVGFTEGTPPAPGMGVEPDDTPLFARPLGPDGALRGQLADDDPDMVRFEVTEPGHQWELRGIIGIRDLELLDGNGVRVGMWTAQGGTLVVPVALPPGAYTARLRGDGPYALRLSDLGPVPADYAVEPNDRPETARRLRIGDAVAGRFHVQSDRDLFSLRLAAPTPLTVTLTPPDDGRVVARLSHDGQPWASGEARPETGALSYTATFPEGAWLFDLAAGDNGISGRYGLAVTYPDGPTGPEPDHLSGRVQAMPADGRFSGQIGGFDALDKVFVPLPKESGTALAYCAGGHGRATLFTYGDDERLAIARPGEIARIDYAPELGGAVELRIEGGTTREDYRCRILYEPAGNRTLSPLAHIAGDPPQSVPAGTEISGSLADPQSDARLLLDLPPGSLAAYRCGFEGLPETDMTRQLRLEGSRSFIDSPRGAPLPSGLLPFLTGDAPTALRLIPPRDAAFPLTWRCEIHGEEAFVPPSEMGPAAPFTAFAIRTPERAGPAPAAEYDPDAALALLSGGRPDWLRPAQQTETLEADLALTGADTPFQAYALAGQRADLVLRLTAAQDGPQDEPQNYTLSVRSLADGWRLSRESLTQPLAGGESAELALTLEVPPMQSALADPALEVTVSSGTAGKTQIFPIPFDALAPARDPQRHWTAPDGLRGGLDPLDHRLGARLTAMDGAPVTEGDAETYRFLHDGAAYHSDIPRLLGARSLSFAMAEPSPVAGLRVHLRSTAPRASWPDRIALELSENGTDFVPVLTATLGASDGPQLFELPETRTASHARLRLFGCQGDPGCDRLALSDIGLIAPPDWRPAAPLNIAAPELGGHVITAFNTGASDHSEQNQFRGSWNVGLLKDGDLDPLGRAGERIGSGITAIVGFAKNRAASVSAIDWVDAEIDGPRLDPIRVSASLSGPAGPWTPLGTLGPPPEGAERAHLTLDAPVWARALRFEFTRDPDTSRIPPDRIAVYEAPGAPSVLGLWEDDRPDAGYEWQTGGAPRAAPAPAGGPDQPRAAPLAMGEEVRSSVLLERNEDWWRITVPGGPAQLLALDFDQSNAPEFAWRLADAAGAPVPLTRDPASDRLRLTARLVPGAYDLTILEPPRSVVIAWDTSGSVASYIPRTLAAVRVWSGSLQPDRDALQLLPFGTDELLMDNWGERPEDVFPYLAALPQSSSSDAEGALAVASDALLMRDGARGVVLITDGETSQIRRLWQPLLAAKPRVVALSIDSSDPDSVRILKDWTAVNNGYFHRVTGQVGLADGLDLAAAIFRAPKGYRMRASLEPLREPEGQGALRISAITRAPDAPPPAPGGGLQVILDASGSMLQRMPDGQRRIAVAHDALAGLVRDTIPPGTPFAFRAFGLEKDACRSELLLPFAPLDPARAEAAIRGTPAINLAKTAIADSLALAAQDLAALDPPRVIVLVTDGDETCEGDAARVIAGIRDSGVDVRLTIVGFAIDDAALAETFAGWAALAGGRYLPAGDSAALADAMSEAIAPRFALERQYVDGRTERVAVLELGEARTLPAGRYRLTPLQTATGDGVAFDLTDGADRTIQYDAAQGLRPPDP